MEIPVNDYRALASQFNPTELDAEDWIIAVKSTGMKWITTTVKHHDGSG